jgi:hypothetical protein
MLKKTVECVVRGYPVGQAKILAQPTFPGFAIIFYFIPGFRSANYGGYRNEDDIFQ